MSTFLQVGSDWINPEYITHVSTQVAGAAPQGSVLAVHFLNSNPLYLGAREAEVLLAFLRLHQPVVPPTPQG